MVKKTVVVLYISGLILLILAIKMRLRSEAIDESCRKYLQVNEPFDIDQLQNSKTFRPYGEPFELKQNYITALFVITSSTYSPCINDLLDFNFFLKQRMIVKKPIQQVVLVLDHDSKRAWRFVKTTEFVTPVIVNNDSSYFSQFRTFGDIQSDRQILFIENSVNTVFFRAIIQQGQASPMKTKEELFEMAEKALQDFYRNARISNKSQ